MRCNPFLTFVSHLVACCQRHAPFCQEPSCNYTSTRAAKFAAFGLADIAPGFVSLDFSGNHEGARANAKIRIPLGGEHCHPRLFHACKAGSPIGHTWLNRCRIFS
jgi:hypothetical protein